MRFAKPIFQGVMTVAIFAVVVLVPVKLVPMVQQWIEDREAAGTKHAALVQAEKLAELASDQPDTLIVPEDVYKTLGMTLAQVQPAVAPEPLKLDGSLHLLANSIVHVRSRFFGDVVEVGPYEDPVAPVDGVDGTDSSAHESRSTRQLQFGDFVRKGQLLAVVWSKDLGEKKSELVDAISKLETDRNQLEQYLKTEVGVVPKKQIIDARRTVEADSIARDRARRTLVSWRLTEEEINAIEKEAEGVRRGRIHPEAEKSWARVEVRSVCDGTIVEKNLAVGDYIDNDDLDLFKIADLSRMDVVAHAYEEDVPALESLAPTQRDWTIHLKANPGLEPLRGRFDRIGNIIDPTQHTAIVMGWVDNSRGRLRVGQFITAQINLPTPDNEVSIPVSALIDQDGKSFVFVRSPTDPQRFTRRSVFPVRRRGDIISLRCKPRGHVSSDGSCAVELLNLGDWVVTTGGLQMAAELTNLQSQSATLAVQDTPPLPVAEQSHK
ncbi:MAG TPA: efflux RND transporter periplasmic adaptor subunit [Planctomycetaceae bacterium]